MRKKSLAEYAVIGLFILCMGLALSASLEYVTRATERVYLLQGKWLLTMLAITLALFGLTRFISKLSRRMSDRAKNALFIIASVLFMAAGLAARLWVIDNIEIQPASDFETYWRLANYLLNDTLMSEQGDLYREYVALYPHTIGFPMMVLWPVFKLFGSSVKNALYANLVCSMLSIPIAGRIGRRCGGRIGGLYATAALSLWPSHIFFSNMIATEPAFTLFILIATDLLTAALDRGESGLYYTAPERAVGRLALGGIVLALAGAIRPMAIIMLAAYGAVVVFGGDSSPPGVEKHGAQYTLSKGWLCLIAVLIPYLATQLLMSNVIEDTIMEKPAGGITSSGYNLMVGVNVESNGLWNQEDADFFAAAYDETGSTDLAHQMCIQKAIERARTSPEDVLNLLVYKFRDLWQTDDFGIDWNLLWLGQQGLLTPEMKDILEQARPVGRVVYMCALLFALSGALNLWKDPRATEPSLLLFMLFYLGTALAHMLLETQVRYHYNMIPYLILLSSTTLSRWRFSFTQEPVVAAPEEPENEDTGSGKYLSFDIPWAIREGHLRITATKAYLSSMDIEPFETEEAKKT